MSAKKKSTPTITSGDADLARLLDILGAFSRQTIVVLGDFVADESVGGEISRVSREAPVLILRHRSTTLLPGGGANAANNLIDRNDDVLTLSRAIDERHAHGIMTATHNNTFGFCRNEGAGDANLFDIAQ